MLKGSIHNSSEKRFKNTKGTKVKVVARTVKTGGSMPSPVYFLMIVYHILIFFPVKSSKNPFFLKKKTFKSQKFVAEEKKSEINRKKWGKDPEKRPNTNNSIANEIFGLNDNIEPFSNQKEELIVPEEDDASLVNCIDSLDMESVNFLRESMRLVMKKPEKIEKIPKNDEIEEILEEVPENFGAGKEENEEIQEEIYNYTIKQPEIKEKKPEFVKKNMKIIKARPISANFNSLMSRETRELKKEGSEGVFASNNQRLNTNPFSRPQTELSNRITKVKEQDTTNVSKV